MKRDLKATKIWPKCSTTWRRFLRHGGVFWFDVATFWALRTTWELFGHPVFDEAPQSQSKGVNEDIGALLAGWCCARVPYAPQPGSATPDCLFLFLYGFGSCRGFLLAGRLSSPMGPAPCWSNIYTNTFRVPKPRRGFGARNHPLKNILELYKSQNVKKTKKQHSTAIHHERKIKKCKRNSILSIPLPYTMSKKSQTVKIQNLEFRCHTQWIIEKWIRYLSFMHVFTKTPKIRRPQKIPQAAPMQQNTILGRGGHFGRHGLLFWGICGTLCFKGCIMGKIIWNLCVFWKIPVREWGRRGRWWAHTLGNESYALDLVF